MASVEGHPFCVVLLSPALFNFKVAGDDAIARLCFGNVQVWRLCLPCCLRRDLRNGELTERQREREMFAH